MKLHIHKLVYNVCFIIGFIIFICGMIDLAETKVSRGLIIMGFGYLSMVICYLNFKEVK